ncbi:MAG: glucose-1-phosphate cytidylyltransferase [Caulobacteraceae bacterium]
MTSSTREYQPKVVILAGGRGTRIAEETAVRPKPMVEIGGRPLLWHIMKSYSAHGLNDFVICCGYLGFRIREYFLSYAYQNADLTILPSGAVEVHQSYSEPWTITLVDTGLDTMTGGRVKRIARYIQDCPYFCLTYGDGLSDVNIAALVDYHQGHGALATVTAVTPLARFGALELSDDVVERFTEKPQNEGGLINGGFFVLSPKVLDHIEGDDTVFEGEPLEALARRGELRAFRHTGFWQPMDTLRDKVHLEQLWATTAPWKVW